MNNTLDQRSLTPWIKFFIILSVMMVAIIEVLDMTIVNVALPQMMGELGANSDQITWVLTSYVVSSAIVMPLTGFLVARIGQRKLLLINVIGFLIFSALCGASQTLSEIVFFRILQGIFGASLVPISQYILRDTFPIEQQGKAMAIWGIGIMVAPILGPTLGGYITSISTWRWVFYLNVPFCIIAIFLILQFIKKTEAKKIPIDYIGMLLLIVGVGSLQVFLDRGNTENWFDSKSILILAIVAVLAIFKFIVRGISNRNNVIDFRIFRNRNFVLSTLILMVYCMGTLGVFTIRPIMLERLMGYTAKIAGLSLAPAGIASILGMLITASLMKRINPKILLLFGVGLTIAGSFIMANQSNTQISFLVVTLQNSISGLGMGTVFLIVSALSLSTLSKELMAVGAGVFSFGRNMGVSIGISLLSTLVSRTTQTNWNTLAGHITPSNNNLQLWLQAHNMTLQDPTTSVKLGQVIATQANMLVFIDAYWAAAIGGLVLIPLILLLKPPKELTPGGSH